MNPAIMRLKARVKNLAVAAKVNPFDLYCAEA